MAAYGFELYVVGLVLSSVALAAATPSRTTHSRSGKRIQWKAGVVSTTLESDEVLLGLRNVAPVPLRAITAFADDPGVSNVSKEARAIESRVTTDPETILSIGVETVFVAPFATPEAVSSLERSGMHVVRLPFSERARDIAPRIATIGNEAAKAAKSGDAAASLTRATQQMQREVNTRLATRSAVGAENPSVLFLSSGGYTAGAETLISEILERAGGENAAASMGLKGHTTVDMETALRLDPDLIIVNTYLGDEKGRVFLNNTTELSHPAWKTLRAVRESHVYAISGRALLTTSQYTVQTLATLQRILERYRTEAAR